MCASERILKRRYRPSILPVSLRRNHLCLDAVIDERARGSAQLRDERSILAEADSGSNAPPEREVLPRMAFAFGFSEADYELGTFLLARLYTILTAVLSCRS